MNTIADLGKYLGQWFAAIWKKLLSIGAAETAEQQLLQQILNCVKPLAGAAGAPVSIIVSSIGPVVTRFSGGWKMDLAVALVDNQKVFVGPLVPGPDAAGKPATFKSVPVWKSSDESVAKVAFFAADGVTPVTDGLSGWIVAGNPGAATVTITVEGDVTPGVDTLTQNINCAVSGGDPTSMSVPIGTPVNQ